MFVACMRMVRRSRYDLIHAVEESAFIAAASQTVHGVPYVYDMDSSLAEQMVEAYPRLQFALPFMRYCESLAIRRSLGVLTVCAALEDLALGHDPAKAVGRVEDSTLLPPGAPGDANGSGPIPEAVKRDGPIAHLRRQSGAVPGHRPAARGVPAHPADASPAPTWSSSAAARTTSSATGGSPITSASCPASTSSGPGR